MYDDYFFKANELMQKGEPFVTATVVRAEKPTSGKPGDKAIITVNGVMHGWIGGSCAQPTVIKEALRALADDTCRLIRLSNDPESQTPRDGLIDMPMTCFSGGTLEIYIEPQRPKPRLMVIGNLPTARAIVHLGKAMNYHVLAVDPDTHGAEMSAADEIITSLDQLEDKITPLTYVVVATHGHYDEPALEKALKRQAAYVGLVASKKRAEAVREYLKFVGLGEADLLAFKAPAGLDIQARRGDEIALSIMAEIVQVRRNAELLDLALLKNEPALPEITAAESAVQSTGTTICLPCGMELEIATAKFSHEHEGETYYFCCPACRRLFANEPDDYLLIDH
ncbi:MAG: XdhC family protein [Ardenticatenaceae bacterium]|nr:XdhC family protein [Ardenticatenaceae bacterium]